MPTKTEKAIAKKTHTTLKTTEKNVERAKKEYPTGTPDRWRKIMGTAKKIDNNKHKKETKGKK